MLPAPLRGGKHLLKRTSGQGRASLFERSVKNSMGAPRRRPHTVVEAGFLTVECEALLESLCRGVWVEQEDADGANNNQINADHPESAIHALPE